MFIGRIISDCLTIDSLEYFDITTDTTKCVGSDIPVLIVGKELALSIYGKEKIKVLDRKIEKNVYWTYCKFEKRNEFEKDFNNFISTVIKNTIKSVNYRYIDILLSSYNTVKGFVKFINGNWKKIIYITDKHMYIYHNNVVYGISFSQLDYAGINRNKVINKIKSNHYNKIINNNFISKEMKKCLNNTEISVPYLYFIRENN